MENRKLWFKAKRYGLGWYPCSWQGWAVLALYVLGALAEVLQIDFKSPGIPKTFWSYYIYLIVSTTFLIIICYTSGEKPRWRWGNKKNENIK